MRYVLKQFIISSLLSLMNHVLHSCIFRALYISRISFKTFFTEHIFTNERLCNKVEYIKLINYYSWHIQISRMGSTFMKFTKYECHNETSYTVGTPDRLINNIVHISTIW